MKSKCNECGKVVAHQALWRHDRFHHNNRPFNKENWTVIEGTQQTYKPSRSSTV